METLTIIFEYTENGYAAKGDLSKVRNLLLRLLIDDEDLHHIAETAVAYRLGESPKPLFLASHVLKTAESVSLGELPPSRKVCYDELYPEWKD